MNDIYHGVIDSICGRDLIYQEGIKLLGFPVSARAIGFGGKGMMCGAPEFFAGFRRTGHQSIKQSDGVFRSCLQ